MAPRKHQSGQHSTLAKSVVTRNNFFASASSRVTLFKRPASSPLAFHSFSADDSHHSPSSPSSSSSYSLSSLSSPPAAAHQADLRSLSASDSHLNPQQKRTQHQTRSSSSGDSSHNAANPQSLGSSLTANGVGTAFADTPAPTAPPSPQISPRSQGSGTSTPGKHRATTLDIPGLTKSKVSPDGRIAERDVGSKLVIVMVGLPARGKSYITKKLSRYLNWLQHDTRIFNVGERRRVAAGSTGSQSQASLMDLSMDARLRKSIRELSIGELPYEEKLAERARLLESRRAPSHTPLPPAAILVNDKAIEEEPQSLSIRQREPSPMTDLPDEEESEEDEETSEGMDQSAKFFDPENERAVQIREQVALATLDELLDYILEQGGSVGILDATNSTVKRRQSIMDHIQERAGPLLNVLFLESCCYDESLLKANMRLKLSGPDYKGMEPAIALDDFQKRVKLYEKFYVPLGQYEEQHNMPYVQTIDVSRKLVAHQANGFLASQVVYYLLNFNLSPRQIWISRHGESLDDLSGKIGGNAPLSENGIRYAKALARFMDYQRQRWEEHQKRKALSTHFPPLPGDSTPPNPQYAGQTTTEPRNFCVWTSMLQRSIQTAQFFDEEVYDVKEMRMLDELNSGLMEGLTYDQIRQQFPNEFDARRKSKLHYRFPGPGGEGYLDVINRLRAVIVEVERMTEHVLLVGPRSVARTLLAYFLGLKREDLTDLAVPPGIIYSLEPKPYGVEYKVYKYDPESSWFEELPDYKVGQTSYY